MPEKPSIISAIQDMIKSGASEAQIIQNLREMGVSADKAKQLLAVGQADIYSVLQSEINRQLDEKFEQKKPEIVHHLQDELQLAEEATAKKVQEKNLAEFKEYEKYSENRLALFQSQVSESSNKALQAADLVRERLLINEQRLHKLELEGPGKEAVLANHSRANLILVGLGVIFGLATLYMFYFGTAMLTSITTEALIIGVVLAMVSISLFFISTLV